jgi:glutamate racemase
MSTSEKAPIGVFDSGIGGLTVVKSIMARMPEERIVYFGDTARVPYGIKSPETVKEYALQITDFLLKRDVKMIVIACNTVSAAAENDVRAKASPIPVIGVVEAGARVAIEHSTRNRLVGVIGTLATVNSGTYESSIKTIDPGMRVFSKSCPMLVPLAEEGWIDNDVAMLTLKHYLDDFQDKNLDSLILGCTHYPLFKDSIRTLLPDSVDIIDSADAVAKLVDDTLRSKNLRNTAGKGSLDCFVSDKPQRFQLLAERFLGRNVNQLEVVNVA